MKHFSRAAGAVILALTFAVPLLVYRLLPPVIASHWGAAGEVNGYSSKAVGLFILPIVALASYLLVLYLPKIDPLKSNVEKFRDRLEAFAAIFAAFMCYVELLTVAWNLGGPFDLTRWMTPGLALLFLPPET